MSYGFLLKGYSFVEKLLDESIDVNVTDKIFIPTSDKKAKILTDCGFRSVRNYEYNSSVSINAEDNTTITRAVHRNTSGSKSVMIMKDSSNMLVYSGGSMIVVEGEYGVCEFDVLSGKPVVCVNDTQVEGIDINMHDIVDMNIFSWVRMGIQYLIIEELTDKCEPSGYHIFGSDNSRYYFSSDEWQRLVKLGLNSIVKQRRANVIDSMRAGRLDCDFSLITDSVIYLKRGSNVHFWYNNSYMVSRNGAVSQCIIYADGSMDMLLHEYVQERYDGVSRQAILRRLL